MGLSPAKLPFIVDGSTGEPPPPADTTAPTVTVSHSTYKIKGKTYYSITMAADEPATIFLRIWSGVSLTGGGTEPVPSSESGWLEYRGAFEVKQEEGHRVIEYWARDAAGNASMIRSYSGF